MGQRIIWLFSFFLLRILTFQGYAPISVLGGIKQFLPMEDNKRAYSLSIFAFSHPANIFISQFLVISACVLTTMPALFPVCQHKNVSVIQFCVCICWAREYPVPLSAMTTFSFIFIHVYVTMYAYIALFAVTIVLFSFCDLILLITTKLWHF